MKPGVTLDVWQRDLCARHEKAFWCARARLFPFQTVDVGAGRACVVAPSGFKIDLAEFEAKKNKGTRAAEHAPPQHGKSIIVSQCQPAWILGYEPAHRFRLATMNIEHSREFSEVVLNIMRSPEHTSVFPDPAGHPEAQGRTVKWFTNARRLVNDGQSSFTALGLQTGFVGTGADTLVIDDPYKSIEEALSEVIRAKTWRFYTDTAKPRLDEDTNVFIMFHRYHQDDIAGRALITGEFDLWRYPAISDGDYTDEQSGRTFPDPLSRAEGEYLTPRKPPAYYARQRENEQVWNSQFQGRPTSKSGSMFNVERFGLIHADDVPAMLARVRAWDNAATAEGEGATAYTAGVKAGIDAAGLKYLFHVVREQVGTDEREALQLKTAREDGKLCAVRAPQDPGSAGKDIAFKFRQLLKEFQVETKPVTGSKTARAHNYSAEVGAGRYFVVCDERDADESLVPPDWFKAFKEEHRFFPVGTTKDMVDAGADADKYLTEIYHRGLVVKGYDEQAQLVAWSVFAAKYGDRFGEDWDVSAGIIIQPDMSLPSGWAVLARPPENLSLGDAVFLLASERRVGSSPDALLEGLKGALDRLCVRGASRCRTVWLGRDSQDVGQLAADKYDLSLYQFKDEPTAGLAETNWYFQPSPAREHPFQKRKGAPRLLMLVEQPGEPKGERDLLSTRQELVSWTYNERGEPQAFGGVTLDCLRMVLCDFSLSSKPMTKAERRETLLPDHLRGSELMKKIGTPEFVDDYWARQHALGEQRKREERDEREEAKRWSKVMGRPASHRRYKR